MDFSESKTYHKHPFNPNKQVDVVLKDSVLYLLCDIGREHQVIQHMPKVDETIANVRIVEGGDYVIAYKNHIRAFFERKTLADFRSSLDDGRYERNCKRMEILAKEHNAHSFLIFEHEGGDKLTRTPHKSHVNDILDAITDLTKRGYIIVYTDSSKDTAERLIHYRNAYDKKKIGGDHTCGVECDTIYVLSGIASYIKKTPKKTRSDAEAHLYMLASLKGHNDLALSRLKRISIVDLLIKDIDIISFGLNNTLDGVIMDTRSRVGIAGYSLVLIKMLEEVPLMTENKAKRLIEKYSFYSLCTDTPGKFGSDEKLIGHLQRIVNHKYT